MSEAEFAILGAGAMGSILAAHLARAGHSVVLLARGERAQQIEREGLRIRGLAEFAVRVQTITDPRQLRRADVLMVATKARATPAALELLRQADVELAFSVQNGVMKNEILAQAFGAERVLGALANTSGELLSSGEVRFTRNVNLLLGEPGGEPGARAGQLAKTLDASGVRSTAVHGIRSHEWSKFVAWVPFVALAVVTRANTWKFLSDPDAALVFVRLLHEMGQLAKACGVELSDESLIPVATLCQAEERDALASVLRVGSDFRRNAPMHRLSTLQDLLAGRRLEMEETLGFAARRAAALNLRLPLLENAYRLMVAVDRTREE